MAKKLLIKNQNNLPTFIEEIPDNGIITVGSNQSATIVLNGGVVAPEQFVIVRDENGVTLMCRADGGSLNGTAVSQGTIHNLKADDTISIGDYVLIFDPSENDLQIASENLTKSQNSHTVFENTEKSFSDLADKPISENSYEGSLKDVLAGLRAEEKFYFLIRNKEGESRRIYVESEEMWLGWSEAGECLISKTQVDIQTLRCEIRKDWSGVVIQSLGKGFIKINGEITNEAHRLKNDDNFTILDKEGSSFSAAQEIIFHEPTALLVLDSILPKELPPPISIDTQNRAQISDAVENTSASSENGKTTLESKAATLKNGLYFGYFTFTEILIMVIATIITAILIFLVIEFY